MLDLPPALSVPLVDQIASQDSPFSYVVPTTTFTDPDAGDTLTYSATGMPAWLNFNAATHTFSGEFTLGADAGTFNVSVTATDSYGLYASDQFLLIAAGVNHAPFVVTSNTHQTVVRVRPSP